MWLSEIREETIGFSLQRVAATKFRGPHSEVVFPKQAILRVG